MVIPEIKSKILCVDDDPNSLELLKALLTPKFNVMTLSSAKEIISVLHSFKPDVILLDMLMPGAGGVEACDMLNNDPLGEKVPIIVISALDKNIDKLAVYKKGIVDYLVKPITKDVLITHLEKILQSRYPE